MSDKTEKPEESSDSTRKPREPDHKPADASVAVSQEPSGELIVKEEPEPVTQNGSEPEVSG